MPGSRSLDELGTGPGMTLEINESQRHAVEIFRHFDDAGVGARGVSPGSNSTEGVAAVKALVIG